MTVSPEEQCERCGFTRPASMAFDLRVERVLVEDFRVEDSCPICGGDMVTRRWVKPSAADILARTRPNRTIENELDRLRRYDAALELLAVHGVSPAPGSRLSEYRRRIRESATPRAEDGLSRIHADYARATLEVDEIICIAEALPDPLPSTVVERLRKLSSDSPYSEPTYKGQGRDAQFELSLYARFRRGNLPVEMANPDLLVQVGGHTVAIEAKRPKTLDALFTRVRKAAKQLKSSPHVRVVALSVDDLIPDRQTVLFAQTPDEIARHLSSRLEAFHQQHDPEMWEGLRKAGVAGILTFYAALCVEAEALVWHRINDLRVPRQASAEHAEAVGRLYDAMGTLESR